MRAPNFARIRISVVAALIAAVTIGLIEFDGRPKFHDFPVLSVGMLVFVIPLLWIDWFWRHDISIIHIGIASVVGSDALGCWSGGNRRDACFLAVLFLAMWAALIRRAIRPLDEDRQQENLEFLKAEDIRCFHVLSNTVGLLACFTGSALLWRDPKSTGWAILLLLPMVWFGWRVMWHLFIRPRSLNRRNGSAEERVSEETHP
jgi:hypothetical protein